jgi:hypothetical protein
MVKNMKVIEKKVLENHGGDVCVVFVKSGAYEVEVGGHVIFVGHEGSYIITNNDCNIIPIGRDSRSHMIVFPADLINEKGVFMSMGFVSARIEKNRLLGMFKMKSIVMNVSYVSAKDTEDFKSKIKNPYWICRLKGGIDFKRLGGEDLRKDDIWFETKGEDFEVQKHSKFLVIHP